MAAEPNFDHTTKEDSKTQSPTSVFAVAELNNVFRAPDNNISEVVGDQEKENRPLAPSLICSFATDAELSTFSEDTQEEGDGDNEDNAIIFRPRFALQRRRNNFSRSIFRSASDDNENSPTKKKQRFSAPPLCLANDIGSCGDDDTCDATCDLPPILLSSQSYSFASSFKNVCHDSSCISQTNTSSFTSLFAASAAASGNTSLSASVEAAVGVVDRSTSPFFSIMPRQLTYPLFLEALPILRATTITSADDDAEN
eukprot:CAMPEP_0196135864 /NCGR_PEP_ID=MMETSP0910-20130528/4364_1 /TAXON_ID=49265 /ORGANISM="Thalassiosira rotula, Strain GSO102" /LENGTH=254 /DNA_ID=CAMNT_0041396061 /DNA_START=38 /DNA_END=802 /DNA_ORIENTATION=+